MNERPTKGVAVDCGCLGNPGNAEYKGVDIETGKQVFYYKISGLSTNNIAEFLAIVHGLAFIKKNNLDTTVYSDSMCALAWVKHKKCNTKFKVTDQNQKKVVAKAEQWLKDNSSENVAFWSNKKFGETPADFGRKGNYFKPKIDWEEEIRKCKESPYYYATKYLTCNGQPFTTLMDEQSFNNHFKLHLLT